MIAHRDVTSRVERPEGDACIDAASVPIGVPVGVPDTPPSIASWLHAMSRRMNVPAAERMAVCDELDAHLRQRVQELMLCGVTEASATLEAIEELGDAAQLADRYTKAYTHPRRRRVMQIGTMSIAGAAVLAAVVVVNGPGNVIPSSAYQPPQGEQTASLRDIKVTVDHSTRWGDVLTFLGKAANMPVFVHWPQLRALGGDKSMIDSDAEIGVDVEAFSLDSTISMLNDHYNLSNDDGVAYRVQEGRLIFATESFFDKQDTVLITYDLSAAIKARQEDLNNGRATAEIVTEIQQLVTSLVHPNLWESNGGDRARMQTYGSKLFVSAPKRLQPEVQWVLAEMASAGRKNAENPGANAGPAAGAGDVQVRAFPLQHMDASETLAVMRDLRSLQPVDFTKAVVDVRTNSIIVQGTPEVLGRAATAIDALDRPVQNGQKPAAAADRRFQIRAADEGGLVVLASDGSEVRCEELNIDPEAGMLAVPVGEKGRSVPVLSDLPILGQFYGIKPRTVPLRELPR